MKKLNELPKIPLFVGCIEFILAHPRYLVHYNARSISDLAMLSNSSKIIREIAGDNAVEVTGYIASLLHEQPDDSSAPDNILEMAFSLMSGELQFNDISRYDSDVFGCMSATEVNNLLANVATYLGVTDESIDRLVKACVARPFQFIRKLVTELRTIESRELTTKMSYLEKMRLQYNARVLNRMSELRMNPSAILGLTKTLHGMDAETFLYADIILGKYDTELVGYILNNYTSYTELETCADIDVTLESAKRLFSARTKSDLVSNIFSDIPQAWVTELMDDFSITDLVTLDTLCSEIDVSKITPMLSGKDNYNGVVVSAHSAADPIALCAGKFTDSCQHFAHSNTMGASSSIHSAVSSNGCLVIAHNPKHNITLGGWVWTLDDADFVVIDSLEIDYQPGRNLDKDTIKRNTIELYAGMLKFIATRLPDKMIAQGQFNSTTLKQCNGGYLGFDTVRYTYDKDSVAATLKRGSVQLVPLSQRGGYDVKPEVTWIIDPRDLLTPVYSADPALSKTLNRFNGPGIVSSLNQLSGWNGEDLTRGGLRWRRVKPYAYNRYA